MDESDLLVNGHVFRGGVTTTVTVGRMPGCDVVVAASSVSRRHAVIELTPGGWVLRDLGSQNGTHVDGRRINAHRITGPLVVTLGSGPDAGRLEIDLHRPGPSPAAGGEPQPSQLGRLSREVRLPDRVTRFGRDASNDIVVPDLIVSRRHAEARPLADGTLEVVDLGSHNGTYVNGDRIARAVMREGDLLSIGSAVFSFTRGRLEEYQDAGAAWLLAEGLTVSIGSRVILDRVDFALEPASLLAVVGPSGSGKTTLLNALTGFKPADSGNVAYAGRDLYTAYDDLRRRMGFVPQDDVLHRELGARRALRYAAELRFPPDVDRRAREARVEEVLHDLGLREHGQLAIERLSGGQRKRTSVGTELLTKPGLLFLDEPTSGLDPGNEQQLMQLLRRLADGGRTVVVVTHAVQSLDLCDRVLFLSPGGRVAYFGPPGRALSYFREMSGGSESAMEYPDIFRRLEQEPGAPLADQYRGHADHRTYVRQPLRSANVNRRAPRRPHAAAAPRHSRLRQLSVLIRRQLAVLGADRRNAALLAAQAPFFGVLSMLVFGADKLTCRTAPEATMLIWLLVVGATWLGASNAIREIVKERTIYQRERAVGLSTSAYVASKAITLGTITVLQSIVLVLVSLSLQRVPPIPAAGDVCAEFAAGIQPAALLLNTHLELIVDTALTGLAAMGLALAISALLRSGERAATMLPYILIFQTIVSQPFFAAAAAPIEAARVVTSASWGMAAASSTVDLNRIRSTYVLGNELIGRALESAEAPAALGTADPQAEARAGGYAARGEWRQSPETWVRNVGGLATLTLVTIFVAWLALRRQDPRATRPRRRPRRR